jgi:uncharacterized protein (TIRG00374 family)
VLSRGTRTTLLARGLGVPLALRQGLTVQVVADGAASITPARVGADPAKILVLRQAGAPLPDCGAILVGEAFSEGIVLTLTVVIMIGVFGRAGLPALGAMSYVLSTLTVISVALVMSGPNRKRLLRALPLSPARRVQALQAMRHFAGSARRLLHLPVRTKAIILLAAALHLCARLALLPILTAGSVHAAQLPALLAWGLTLLYAGSLVPLPSAGGMMELGFAAVFRAIIPAQALVAVLLWWRIYTFYLGALMGALVLTITRRRA